MSNRISHRGVIVGTDGSPWSQAAVKWAAREAVMRQVPLTVVHVVAPLSVAASALAWPAGRVPEKVLEIQENDGRRVIADAITLVKKTVGGDRPEIDSELLFGRYVPALTDLSKEAQLMVVGSRGRTGKH